MTETLWISAIVALCSVISALGGAIVVLYKDRKDGLKEHTAEKDSLRMEHRIEKDLLIEEHTRTIKSLERAFNFVMDYSRIPKTPITEKEIKKSTEYFEDRLNKRKTPIPNLEEPNGES